MFFRSLALLVLTAIPVWCVAGSSKVAAKLDEHFFAVLNAEKLPVEYGENLRKNNKKAALKAAVKHFRTRPRSKFFTQTMPSSGSIRSAKKAINGEVVSIRIPHKFPDGKIDFLYNPTGKDTPYNAEWQWQLNRTFFWRDMALVYNKTKDEKYAIAFNRQIRHWIIDYPKPASKWNSPNSVWRTIETGIRLMGSWQYAFEFFRPSPSLPDETIALILASMHEQAQHALNNCTGNNWIMMELNGAHTFAVLFPEFKTAEHIRKNSSRVLAENLKKQVLPDGMQYELSPGYHALVFKCAFDMYKLARQEGGAKDISPELTGILENMADAFLKMMTPSFTLPLCNDTGRSRVERCLKPALELRPDRQDFIWAASRGKRGMPPAGQIASRVLPWAGFAVMRSSWQKDALYLCFDAGQLGVGGHFHQDKLNINLYKGSQELLFDDGGGQYERSALRSYARSSADHNTILVDGMGQQRRKEFSAPKQPNDLHFAANDKFEYAKGFYNGFYTRKNVPGKAKKQRYNYRATESLPATHTREILFVKPDFFVVADTLRSRDKKAHSYTMLLQLDTLDVKTAPGWVHAVYKGQYDLYAMILSPDVEIKVDSGQMKPLSGWYVGRRNVNLRPASTVKITADKKKSYRFTTLLFPLKKGDPLPRIKQLDKSLWQVTFNGKKYDLDLKNLKNNIPQ